MNMRLTLVAAALAGLAVGGAAYAKADKGHGPRMTFEQLDTNGAGELTQTELQARGAARFAETDTDGDGFLTAEEIEAAGEKRAKKRAKKMMSRLDADNDGKLSAAEMQAKGRGAKMFEKFDADGSGGLSKEEFETAGKKMRGHGRGHKQASE